MGRDKEIRKRSHSHHSRKDSSDESDQSDSSSSLSEESPNSSESSYEERAKKKRRRSSGDSKGREKVKSRSSSKAKSLKDKKRSKEREPKKKDKLKKIEEISDSDYFLKSAEFRVWLSKERGVYFSDLSSEEARKLFKKFVGKWNKGLLSKKYYGGIQSSAVAHDTQSKYKWKFASNIDSGELKTMRDSVSEWSSHKLAGEHETSSSHVSRPSIGPSLPSTSGAIGPSIGPVIGPIRGPSLPETPYTKEECREEEQTRLKRERKEFRKKQELVLDELLPKATGREAKIEKKKVRAEKRRARGYSPDITDPSLMGPKDNIQSKIRSIQQRRETKASNAAQKITDYKAKEKARVEAILEMAKANKKEGALW